MTDYSREKTFAQKKSECFFAGELNEGTGSGDVAAAAGTFNLELANLPPDSIITNAYVMIKTASDAATTAAATLGTTAGGSEILSAIDLTVAAQDGTFTGASLTGTGVTLHLEIVYTGATTAVGEYVVVVEYLEYTKKSGEYTNFT